MSHYRPYPVYKETEIEWARSVPAHWSIVRLKHLGSLQGGAGFPPEMQGSPNNQIAFYKVSDLAKSEDGMYLGTTENTITEEQAKALGAKVFDSGSLAWAKIGAALSLNRRRIVTRRCCLDNNMTGFVVDESAATPHYCFYLMSIVDFSVHAKPGAVPSFAEGDQRELKIPCPPMDEQTAIVKNLGASVAKIDALIAKKTEFIDLLAKKRQALVTHAVTKGLNSEATMRDSGVDWIGHVPDHWERRKISHAFARIGSGTTPPTGEHHWYSDSGIPWITTSELRESVILTTSKHVTPEAVGTFSTLRVYPAGSLAIAMYGATIGRLGILGVPATTNQACCVLSGERSLLVRFACCRSLKTDQQNEVLLAED